MTLFCGYTVLNKLGQGTYGQVYRISDANNNHYALKRPIDRPDNVDCLEFDLLRKAKSSYLLHAMDYLTPFNCVDAKSASIVMPLAKYTGDDIINNIDNLGTRITIMRRLLLGLNCLNNLGYIHADIKPGNIVFYELDHPALSDFGATIYAGDPNELVQLPDQRTTYQFAAPESNIQVNGLYTYSHKSDVWSMGATFYEWLLGRRLFAQIPDQNSYRLIESKLAYEVIYHDLELVYGDMGDIWHQRLSLMLNSMLQIDPAKRITGVEALKFLAVSDVIDETICESNYLTPSPNFRTDFHDFSTARLHLLAFLYRLSLQEEGKLDYAIAYTLCDAFWKCYMLTPPDFDLWSALILGVYCFMLDAFMYQVDLNTTARDLIYDDQTVNMCQYLAITYNYSGLLDVAYVKSLNRSNIQYVFENVFLNTDPNRLAAYYNLPEARVVGSSGYSQDFADFLYSKFMTPLTLRKVLRVDLYDQMFSAKTEFFYNIDDDTGDNYITEFVDPFANSVFIANRKIEIPIVKDPPATDYDSDGGIN